MVNPGSDGLTAQVPVEGVEPERSLQQDQVIEVGALRFQVIETPGHSPGGVCFYLEEEQILMSGDTLFKGSIGTFLVPTANPDEMWVSLAKLAALPSDTKVYPGHYAITTIGHERWLSQPRRYFCM